MKKKLTAIILTLVTLLALMTGCGNKQLLDTTYTFKYAYIELPNGEIIEGVVDSWKDYEDGDQIQVKIDGKTYLTDTTRVVLVSE